LCIETKNWWNDESSFGDCCSSKLADIFVASFEISFEEQISMLDSVDPKVRLSKATELVDRHLQVGNSVNDASYGFGFLLFISDSTFVNGRSQYV